MRLEPNRLIGYFDTVDTRNELQSVRGSLGVGAGSEARYLCEHPRLVNLDFRLGKTGRSGRLAPSRAAALLRDHAGKLRSLSKMMSMRQNFQPCGVRTTSVSYCIAPPTR